MWPKHYATLVSTFITMQSKYYYVERDVSDRRHSVSATSPHNTMLCHIIFSLTRHPWCKNDCKIFLRLFVDTYLVYSYILRIQSHFLWEQRASIRITVVHSSSVEWIIYKKLVCWTLNSYQYPSLLAQHGWKGRLLLYPKRINNDTNMYLCQNVLT